MVALTALVMVLPSAAMAEGPWIDVSSPTDGSVLTAKEVVVEGTASPFTRSLVLEGETLAQGIHTGTSWTNNNLTFRPTAVFRDEFVGTVLNEERWEILLDPANVSVEGGFLKLIYNWTWPIRQETLPMVRSTAFDVPSDVDLRTEFRLKYTGYSYTGSGGGVSSGETDAFQSHMAVYNMWAAMQPPLRVLANGVAVLNVTGYVFDFNTYTLTYSSEADRYYVYRDDTFLAGFETNERPNTFWFGPGQEGMYPAAASIDVDYVDVWTQSGFWESGVVDLGHTGVLDGAAVTTSLSHPRESEVTVWMRASEDNASWTGWVACSEGVPEENLTGRFLQVRMKLAVDNVRKQSAHVTVTGVELSYHCPLVSVEARRQGGEWVSAEGLEEWSATLSLVEDDNVLEVRVTDSAGTKNLTALEVTVDTIIPTGTITIEGEPQYTNDVNVTLLLAAEDKYGVPFVEVSNWPDFSKMRRFPMAERIPWTLLSMEGRTQVFARFVDAHGLVSEPVSTSVIYDPGRPMATIVIDGGKEYTPELAVALGLDASDNTRVVRMEISNHADLSEAREVEVGTKAVNDWKLLEGEDGVRTVYLCVTDIAGNTRVVNDTIEVYTPRALGGLIINEGEKLTDMTVVHLEIKTPVDTRLRLMQLSNTPDFKDAEWEEVLKDRMWVLPEEDGVRTVYLRFLDFRDIASLPVNASILLDTTAPQVTVTLCGGSLYTTDTKVTGTVGYADVTSPVRMWVSMDDTFYRVPPQDFSENFTFTIPSRESDHTIYVMVEDEAGNLGVGSGIIHYATIRPIIDVELPEGKYTRALDRVPLNITPTDPYGGIEVQVAWGTDPEDGDPWTPLNGRVFAQVPPGTSDGRHSIRVRARNAPGLVSEVVSVDVVMDTVAPRISILVPLDGEVVAQRGKVVRLEIDATDATRIVNITYAIDGGEPMDFPEGQLRTNMTMETFGEHTVEVVAEDVAGNVARGTASFTLEESDGAQTAGAGFLMLLVLAVLGAAGAVAYGYNRHMRPGLRPAKVLEGDGWHEEWTAPHLVAGLEEVSSDDAGPPGPIEGLEGPADAPDATDADTSSRPSDELERVVPPPDADGAEEAMGFDPSEWEEM